MNKTWTKW